MSDKPNDVRGNIVRNIIGLIRGCGIQADIFKILRKELGDTQDVAP